MRRLLHSLMVLVSAVTCAPLCAQTRGFQNPPMLATASDPAALATGDWNGDGKPDLAYIDSASTPSLHVLLGSGNGSFTEVQTLVLPATSCSISGSTHGCFLQQADVNGDGLQDLLFAYDNASNMGILSVLLGQSGGTFAAPVQTPIPLNYSLPPPLGLHMAIGDFNGDGKIDVALASIYDSRLYIMSGDGKGAFHTINTLNLSALTYANVQGVYAGDFNKDGKLDLMLYCRSYGAQVVLVYGDGTGNFTNPTYVSLGSMTGVSVFADATGDGIPDIGGYQGNDAVIVPGQSNGTFGTSVDVPAGNTSNDGLLGTASLNGDAFPDLIALSPAGLAVQLGKGQTAFAASQLLTSGNTAPNLFVSGDFNGDGIGDAAIGVPGGIQFLYGNTSGSFASKSIVDTGVNVLSLLSGDFNGDGHPDVAALQSAGSGLAAVRTMLNSPTGALTQGPVLTLTTQGGIGATTGAVADFDGDGRQDIVLNGSPMQFLYGNADGTLTETLTSTNAGFPPFVADVNHDGKPDVVTINGPYSNASYASYDKLVALLNGGTRSYTEVDTSLPTTYSNPYLLAVGDLNGDGFSDAVIYEGNLPGFRVLLGNGDGTFRAGASLTVTTSISYVTAKIADIDNDGHADLILINPQSNGVASNLMVFYGDSAGNLSTPQVLGLSHLYTSGFQLVDVNHMGLLDVVASGGGLVGILHNLGGRSFGSETRIVAGVYPTSVVAADFDGDGYTDIVVANPPAMNGSSTLITELLNTQVAVAGGATVSGVVLAMPSTVAYNQAFTLSVMLSPSAAGLPTPTGTVQFSVDGKFACTATVANAASSCALPGTFTTTLTSGTHTLAGTYSGDATFASGVLTGNMTTLAPNYLTTTTLTTSATTITAGQFVTLTATLTAPVTVSQGLVVFYDGTTILGQASVSSNVAVLQTNLVNIGANTITATYLGYTYPIGGYGAPYAFQASTSNAVALAVSAIATSTSLIPSSNSPTAGSVLTLTAKVAAASTPFGAVTFSDNGTPLGTVVLDATGTATYSTVSLAKGPQSLIATYAANGPFASSASSTSPITVNVVSSALPASYSYVNVVAASSSGVQLTAQVSSSDGSIPSGTVTFLEDNQVIAVQALSPGGQASYTVVAGSSATHDFYVSYGGSASIAPSASPVVQSTSASIGPDFTLQLGSGTSAEASPLSSNIHVSIAGNPGWSATTNLRCLSGVPAGYTCQFSPSTVTGSGVSVLRFEPSSGFSIKTAALFAALVLGPLLWKRRRRFAVLACLLLVPLAGCVVGRKALSSQPTIVTVQAMSGTITHAAQALVR